MTYGFIANPRKKDKDATIATASNGAIYTEGKDLHITNGGYHFIYKFAASPIGWYARNARTNEDIWLGTGASPTIELDNLVIKSGAYWAEILQPAEQENQEE